MAPGRGEDRGRRAGGPGCIAGLLLALVAVTAAADDRSIAGVDLPPTVDARDGTTLALNGAGLRKKLLFKVYVGALYVAEPSGDAATLLATDQPARMALHFVRGGIDRDAVNDAWRDGLAANNDEARLDAIAEQRDALLARTPAEVEAGDVLALEYLPGEGTRFSVNGEPRGEPVAGHDFFRAVLATWLGDEPPSARLRAGVLGD